MYPMYIVLPMWSLPAARLLSSPPLYTFRARVVALVALYAPCHGSRGIPRHEAMRDNNCLPVVRTLTAQARHGQAHRLAADLTLPVVDRGQRRPHIGG